MTYLIHAPEERENGRKREKEGAIERDKADIRLTPTTTTSPDGLSLDPVWPTSRNSGGLWNP
jgi:hypothetical protein